MARGAIDRPRSLGRADGRDHDRRDSQIFRSTQELDLGERRQRPGRISSTVSHERDLLSSDDPLVGKHASATATFERGRSRRESHRPASRTFELVTKDDFFDLAIHPVLSKRRRGEDTMCVRSPTTDVQSSGEGRDAALSGRLMTASLRHADCSDIP